MIGEPQELKLSDAVTVTVAELDGWELEQAELLMCDITGGSFDANKVGVATMKMAMFSLPVFARCSIRTMNGESVNPTKNIGEYSRVAKKIGTKERKALYEWATPIYGATEDSEVTVKNSESALPN